MKIGFHDIFNFNFHVAYRNNQKKTKNQAIF